MPEGDTIRALADTFVPHIGEVARLSSPQGRYADFSKLLGRRKLTAVDTHGKHLFLELGNSDSWLHVHLGMYGRVFWQEADVPEPPVGAIRLRMVLPSWTMDLRAPITCESMSATQKMGVHSKLGLDPLVEGEDFESMIPWLRETTKSIGAVLLHQDVFAGVGNVYRCELPFMLRIDPWTPCSEVPVETWETLWQELVRVMRDSVDNRGGRRRTTTADVKPRHWVYGKVGRPCLVCGTTVVRTVLAGRNLFYCPTCQGVGDRG